MAKDCSSAAGECLQAAVSGTTAVPGSGSSSVMTPVQHTVKDGPGCDVCIQQRRHSDEIGWEVPATKQWLMKRALEFGGALSGVGGGGGGGGDDEPGVCYCCYNPCGGHSHPLPMAEVVSTRVVVAEGERDGLEVCGVFSHLEQQQPQPPADETTKKENLSALVAGIGGGDRCSGNNNKDSSGGGGGGWLLLADAVGAPTYAATMMPVGDKGLPPEARPPWELAAAFKLVECESVLPSPPGEAAAAAAAAAAEAAAAAAAAAESALRTPGRKRKASPGRRGRRRGSAGLPR